MYCTFEQVFKVQQAQPAPKEQPEQTVCMMLLVHAQHTLPSVVACSERACQNPYACACVFETLEGNCAHPSIVARPCVCMQGALAKLAQQGLRVTRVQQVS